MTTSLADNDYMRPQNTAEDSRRLSNAIQLLALILQYLICIVQHYNLKHEQIVRKITATR